MKYGSWQDVQSERYIHGNPCHKVVWMRAAQNGRGTDLYEWVGLCGAGGMEYGFCTPDSPSSFVLRDEWCTACVTANDGKVPHRTPGASSPTRAATS